MEGSINDSEVDLIHIDQQELLDYSFISNHFFFTINIKVVTLKVNIRQAPADMHMKYNTLN